MNSRFFVLATLLLTATPLACGSDSNPPPDDTSTGGSSSKGGSGGKGGSGATGGAQGTGGKGDAAAGGSNGDVAADAPADSPEPGDDGGSSDVSSTETGGSSSETGGSTSDAVSTGGGLDSGFFPGGKAAICAKDPAGLTTCRQLEIACENCPPKGPPEKNPTAKKCFELIEAAFRGEKTDEDCVKFAADNKCTVDSGGNICVTIACDGRPGCEPGNDPMDRKTCLGAARYGEKADCMKYVAKCSCGK